MAEILQLVLVGGVESLNLDFLFILNNKVNFLLVLKLIILECQHWSVKVPQKLDDLSISDMVDTWSQGEGFKFWKFFCPSTSSNNQIHSLDSCHFRVNNFMFCICKLDTIIIDGLNLSFPGHPTQ